MKLHSVKTKHFTELLKAHGHLRWRHRELKRLLAAAAKDPEVRAIFRKHGIRVEED